MAKKEVKVKSDKVVLLPKENENENELTNALHAVMGDINFNPDEVIKAAKEKGSIVNTEPTYFPNEDTGEGEEIEAVLRGFIWVKSKKEGQEDYKTAVLNGKGKEIILVSSKKAVDRLEKMVPIGKVAKLAYLGQKISTTTGNKFHDIRVGYYE